MLLERFADFLKTSPQGQDFRVAITEDTGDRPMYSSVDPKNAPDAEIVEGKSMTSIAVGKPNLSGFTHFLDGAQNAQRIGYYQQMVPIMYGFIGAVIRKRDASRTMSTFDKVCQENLYFSFAHLDPKALRIRDIGTRDASEPKSDESTESSVHPMKLMELARSAVSNDRAELERDLAKAWISECGDDEWLFWDGSITSSNETRKHPRIVGVVKSHNTQYFGFDDQRKILGLKVGERSCVFRPRGKDWTPVYSWYLRLHPNDGKDVYFGLIRVEAAATENTLAMVDEISRWILAERAPLALPDARWDRMIYPIRDCEQYLRSIAPSKIYVEASLSGCR